MRKLPQEPGRQSRAVARTVAADRDFAGNPIAKFDQQTVLAAYSRWAPIYDFVFAKLFFFGAFFDRGRELAIEHINTRSGTVLEVGVGTGVALGRYAPHLAVTGIDLSPDMLAVARKSVVRGHMSHVRELREMDAGALEFPADSFDTVAVMYTISVVPHPEQVMAEVARVLKPGGEVVIVSHSAAERGWRAMEERMMTPLARWLGWSPDFRLAGVIAHPQLTVVESRRLPPLGIFSMVRMQKAGG